MIPESELARALGRWKARKLGLPGNHEEIGADTGKHVDLGHADVLAPAFEETTRVAPHQYHSEVETPPAEVHLSDADYEDHTRR